MPHITIEYSANVADHHDVDAVVRAVHAAALDHGLAALDALRTRAVAREQYRIADGDPLNAFVAITARIGPGRDADDVSSFLAAVLAAAESALDEPAGPLAVAWSAEVTEIDATSRINHNNVRRRIDARREGAVT